MFHARCIRYAKAACLLHLPSSNWQKIRSQRLADALRGMVENLESGQDLASSMQRYPGVFTPIIGA